MPPQTHLWFKNYEREVPVPFIIYAHFDSLQVPQNKTKLEIHHKPCGFAYSVKCSYDDTLSNYEDYVGEDSPQIMWKKLEEEASRILERIQSEAKSRRSDEEQMSLSATTTVCYLCKRDLGRDRCEDFHFMTGTLLGVGHKKCISKPKRVKKPFIPIIMYNFVKYGSHFLKKELTSEEKSALFPSSRGSDMEWGFIREYPKFALRFLDLRRFMDEKMEDLEKILSDSKKPRLKKEFKKALFDLMKKKNYFPYHHMKSFAKFLDKSLPNERGFFDQLHDQDILPEAYQRCLEIWKHFKCATMEDYFRAYAKSSVLLLEDIFEFFRFLCLDKYRLDPAYYCAIASFSWDSMLKQTGVKLEVLQDKAMIEFIKKNIRGGINQCNKRHAVANNKYRDDFDRTKPESFIVYLDANNLGGWAMSQKLPFSKFAWMTKSEIDMVKDKILRLDDDGDSGYIFEVDLDYPQELHDSHDDLPFCLQRMSVPVSTNSPNYTQERSVLTFHNKSKYVIEFRTLKQCLENGLVLKKIHRGLKFHQSNWLQPYIAFNTKLRASARNDFETKFYKLLNNSIYGKTIQKYTDDKPRYAGFSILELSKKFMYDFHYKTMLPKYGTKIDLLYIDTDGVIYEIRTSDFFEDLKRDQRLLKMMDTSNLEPRWDIPKKNKKAVGKMKEEYGGKIIREFFGIGAKRYFLDVEGEEIKKASGVKRYVKVQKIGREDYAKCVLEEKSISRSFLETKTTNDEVMSKEERKVVFSPGDNKRNVLEDKIHTRAWGYQGDTFV